MAVPVTQSLFINAIIRDFHIIPTVLLTAYTGGSCSIPLPADHLFRNVTRLAIAYINFIVDDIVRGS